ncbi:HK97 family phage prohead protease [Haematobacter genomosp. 1]|uniref:Primosome assembly protein PriA n=1 Tax=Haematobacter genomosp. 1 TaxID=366618 RepID=A0A212AA13_9RHOB|nr:HK97 family phage prohead protease [Haematobacter genomosp. 1]OWJ76980.1 primosome assembly protein PriA [Haematobacter genomosp. 1]
MNPKFQNDLRLAPAFSFEVKAEPTGHISGYASTFGGEPDRHGDVVSKGAFARTLDEHRAQGTLPAMLWSHQIESPIGKWLTIEEDPAGLFVVGQINLKTAMGREAFEHIQAGDVGAFSIGYVVPEGGRRYVGKGVFALDEVELAEISIVSVPANRRARITSAKHIGSKAEAISFLREAGLPKAAAARFAAGGFPALSQPEIDHDRALKLVQRIERATLSLRSTK